MTSASARYGVAAGVAVAVALSLFSLMRSLIAMGDAELGEAGRRPVIEFVRLRQDSEAQVRKRELPHRPAVEAKPVMPSFDLPRVDGQGDGAPALSVNAPQLQASLKLEGRPHLGLAPSDTDAVPLVRVQPMFPARAAQRGLEGWVEVVFDIAPTGAVRNAKVVASQPPRVFDRAALKAIRKWKYKPKVEDGAAVNRRGVRVRLSFSLEDKR